MTSPSYNSSIEVLNYFGEIRHESDLQVDFGHELNFRILILGRSGVGKSNLIKAIFGSNFAVVAEHGRKAGVSNIEKEITSPQNPRLILHNFQDFRHGDNFNIVKNFIKTRSQTKNLKDRLHAIWLCSAVPTYGGSLLEVGEEEILQMKDCIVPIVAIFTKYDVLVQSFMPPDEEEFYRDIEKEVENLNEEADAYIGLNTGTPASQIDPHVLSLAEKKLYEIITPFEETLGVPWVKVSVKPEFSDTLEELVDVTEQCVNNSLELPCVITRHKCVVRKIKATIDIAKKSEVQGVYFWLCIYQVQGYWRGLSTSLKLAGGGKSLDKWFNVIHKDIVTIWDIYDPMNVFTLAAKDMSELQQDLVEVGGGTVVRNIIFGAISVTPNVLRGVMGYIVDFTIVMQGLFFLMQARTEASGSRSPVTKRLFKLALDAYKQDIEHSLQKVHNKICSFVTMKKAIFKSETVIKEVERLINDHRFKPSERFVALARAN